MEEKQEVSQKNGEKALIAEAELQNDGWKNTGHYYSEYQIWAKDNDRLLYDWKAKNIFFRYSLD